MLFFLQKGKNGKGKENIPGICTVTNADCDSNCRPAISAKGYIASLGDLLGMYTHANTPLVVHSTGLCSSYPEWYLRFVQFA